MNPDNTLLPQATPGVTVDQFIKAESINVEISECSPDKTIIENLLKGKILNCSLFALFHYLFVDLFDGKTEK